MIIRKTILRKTSLSKTAVVWLAMVAMLSAQSSLGQSGEAAGPAARLPVSRVILYKNGVGYFEHSGRVRDNQDVNVEFTTAQLNDVLKSLTVLDLGKGRITGVSYNSTAPLGKRLGSLRLPVGENPTTAQFLDALRGARVEVRSGSGSASGRLLSIEEREIPGKTDTAQNEGDEEAKPARKVLRTQISLVSDSGEVRVFDLTPAISVRITEKDVNEEVGKYLGLVASTRDQDVRRMTISTAGNGERDLVVSYISEVPVWKSTYRIVIPKDGKPLLQGWAIVDNTVGEDWKNVELSLVAGAPQSFVQELSQPYYTRRPEIPLPENAMLTPQTHEATMEQVDKVQQYAKLQEAPPPAPPPPPAVGVPGGIGAGSAGGIGTGRGPGFGPGQGGGAGGGKFRVDRREKDALLYSPNAGLTLTDELEAGTTVGQSRELGDLFEYKLKDHVTIAKNQSALVPILQTRIDAEKVTVWNPSEAAPLRALWINNTSPLTFDGGTFNVLEGDAFAGEGLMDAVKPGEKRLLSYAADLGLLVDAKQKNANQHVTKIVIAHDVMTQATEERQENTYTIRNRDTAPRVVVIEHPARQGWKLEDGETPAESSASFHRFRMTVDPKTTKTLAVKEYRPISVRYELTKVTDDQIKFFLDQKMINPDVEKALRDIASQKNTIALMNGIIVDRRAQIAAIGNDQQRLRENMKALKGSAEEKALVERYVRELNEQEDSVQSLQKEIAAWQKKRDEAQSRLNDMIEALQMEVTL
jgi:hypothetical protein